MAKKVEVSLKEIRKQIDRAEGKLSKASRAVASPVERKQLAAKIKTLKRIKAQLRLLCRGTYNVAVPAK